MTFKILFFLGVFNEKTQNTARPFEQLYLFFTRSGLRRQSESYTLPESAHDAVVRPVGCRSSRDKVCRLSPRSGDASGDRGPQGPAGPPRDHGQVQLPVPGR